MSESCALTTDQLLKHISAQHVLLEKAQRFVMDYHRSLVKQYGNVQSGEVSRAAHPLIAPFVEDMAEWMRERELLVVPSCPAPTVRAPVVVEGDDIPGVRCVTCEE